MQRLLLALLGAGFLSSPDFARDSKPGSVQGVWEAVQVTMTGPSPRTITIPEPRANVTIMTAKHYSRVEVHAEGPRPPIADVASATADELRAAWQRHLRPVGGEGIVESWGRHGAIISRAS